MGVVFWGRQFVDNDNKDKDNKDNDNNNKNNEDNVNEAAGRGRREMDGLGTKVGVVFWGKRQLGLRSKN